MLRKPSLIIYALGLILGCLLLSGYEYLQLTISALSLVGMFFVGHTAIQIAAEVSVIIGVAILLQYFGYCMATSIWLTAAIWLAVVQVVDIFLLRFMDLSLAHIFYAIMQEGWSNFIEILKASTLSLSVYFLALMVVLVLSVLCFGVLFYRLRKTRHYPMRRAHMLLSAIVPLTMVGISLGLGAIEQLLDNSQDGSVLNRHRYLPWPTTTQPTAHMATFAVRPNMAMWECAQLPAPAALVTEDKPPIFIFIAESLRADEVNAQTAPNLTAFGERYYTNSRCYSAANATPLAWLGILTGLQPCRWASKGVVEMDGSPILKSLINAGYSLHLYTASRLEYYEMDRKLFGIDRSLLSSQCECLQETEQPAWLRDQLTLQALSRDIARQETLAGRVHIVFLEGTHFGYSWPLESSPFEPYAQSWQWITAFIDPSAIEAFKNRYRNSIYQLDKEFGKFIAALSELGQLDTAQIVFTGDHGEEFLEQGHIFHASALVKAQVHVPLFAKWNSPPNSAIGADHTMSHIDIMPTLIHAVCGKPLAGTCCDGVSLFSASHPNRATSWRYNFRAAPCELLIHAPEGAVHGRLNKTARAAKSSLLVLDRAVDPSSTLFGGRNPLFFIPE